MENNVLILVADDNDVSRQLMVSSLEASGFDVIQAKDGVTAFNVVKNYPVSIAIIDHLMSPHDGIKFLKLYRSSSIKVPVILVTDDYSSDILVEAGKYGVSRILQKPINPERIVNDIRKIIGLEKNSNSPEFSEIIDNKFTHEELMEKALELAMRNIEKGQGGPFGAIVADSKGRIVGDGVNAITSRCDPMAHAEVMAIRKAADFLGKSSLRGCSLYTTSEPTAIGQALIISVGIEKVYFGTTHEDVNNARNQKDNEIYEQINKPVNQRTIEYIQLNKDKAIKIVKKWIDKDNKISD